MQNMTSYGCVDISTTGHIDSNISEYTGTIFTSLTDLVGILVGMINLTFFLRLP